MLEIDIAYKTRRKHYMKDICFSKKSLFPELFVSRNGGNSIKCKKNIYPVYMYTFSKRWQYVGDTLAIRQSYDSHTQIRYSIVRHTPKCINTLQIHFRYVRHTLPVRYSCAINTLAVRYTFMPVYLQRMTSVIDL